ncbi:SMC family ATPase [Paraconexibacter antarcticus]|uniref:Nuclease SbcCD subunit C n=1 Tax=Paraconexibacter antarcticus TaxID=2949664 RepID=A0ABY5DQB6_9ACTN|nr:SMC family ATPase [Paraconexibacter antarcticus]UTI63104.1 SMC family ATPase [Paraconexibacter antarcticus]
MRLHHLQVQALQAFATTAEVDFDALSEAGLFLFHGETGAGKTTLLDAVVLALFGKLPGARGTDARERADLAAVDLPTRVVLELTLRGERLRITRTPRQERRKQRGEGTTTVPPTVLLEAIAADGTATAVATRVEEVQHEIDRLLGMSREQFCQVVLLPQGQFATFLHAASDAREELLARLFGTERFEHAERWLTERRKKVEEELRGTRETLRDSASRLAQVLATEAPEGWEDDPGLLTAWADEAQVLADADRATAEGVCGDAATARAAADAARGEVQELVARRARHARAVAELAAFEAGTPARDAEATRLERARAAAPVAPLIAQAGAAADEARAATGAATAACAAAGGAEPVPAALRAAAGAARTSAGEVAALAPVEARVGEREEALRQATVEAAAHAAELAEADEWLERAAGRLTELEAAVATSRLALAQRDDHARAARAALTRQEAAEARDRAQARRAVEREQALGAKSDELEVTEQWLGLREARLEGMAAELADTLEADCPCPVCGAVEHPEPAAHRLLGRVTAEAEDAAKRQVDEARAALAAAEAKLAATDREIAAAAAVAGEEPVHALVALAAAAAAQARDTEQAALAAPGAEAALGAFAAERVAHEASRGTAGEARAAALARAEELTAALAEEQAQLAAARAGAPTIAARVAVLEERASALDAAAAAVEQAEAATRAAGAAADRAGTAAVQAGFTGVSDAAAAVLGAAEVATTEARIRAHDEGLAERRVLVADPELVAAAAAPEPDEAAAMARSREATAAVAEAERALERVRGRGEQLTSLRRELERRVAAYGPAAAEAATVRGLATLVDGTSAQNRKRMRLRAYVLAARLEEIAAAASERLGRMSDGRYALALDDDRASRGRRSGLGLRVVDGWTGQDRHPASLSGGETFMASLALALGLADVVAAESGGARLDTLFVDEGFGSLDERALDKALEVLDRLRDGGRAVGVVSHVAELRQRIGAQLHVVKDREGSRVVQTV